MKRSTLGLAGVLIALVVIAYLVTLKPGETSVTAAEGDLLVDIDSASVDRIEVRSASNAVTLEKQGADWRITYPIGDAADPTPVGQALEKAAAMRVKGIVSTLPDKHGIFQVDSSGTTVTFHQAGREPVTVIIGKASGSFSETYVRRDGSPEVALVDGALSWTFSKPLKDWRNRSLLSLPAGTVTDIRYAYGDTAVAVVFEDSLWTVNGMPANQASVNTLVTSLSALQGDDFSEDPPRSRPMATITVSGITVSFVYDRTEKKYYANRSGDDRWLSIPDWRAGQVLKRAKDLR